MASETTKKDSGGKVHYLKGVPSIPVSQAEEPSSSYESLIRDLGNRIDKIEGEFRRAPVLPSQEASPGNSQDLSALIKNLETKIQKISDDLKKNTLSNRKENPLQALPQILFDVFKKLRSRINWDAYASIL